MKLDEILEEFRKDAVIDKHDLEEESVKVDSLFYKYLKMVGPERKALKSLLIQMRGLKRDKYEFYAQGPNETTPKDWQLPPKGIPLKSEIQIYLDGDKDILNLQWQIDIAQEKVTALDTIIQLVLKNRVWNLGNLFKDKRHHEGEDDR